MQRLKKNALKFLLVVIITISAFSCAPKITVPEIMLDPEGQVRAAAPNCYNQIIALNDFDDAPKNVCNDAIECEQDNAIYWEENYFVLRAQVEAINNSVKKDN